MAVRVGVGVANNAVVMTGATGVAVGNNASSVVISEVPVATVWLFLSPWQITPRLLEVQS